MLIGFMLGVIAALGVALVYEFALLFKERASKKRAAAWNAHFGARIPDNKLTLFDRSVLVVAFSIPLLWLVVVVVLVHGWIL